MQRLVVLLFSLLAHEATAVAALGQGCRRRCGGLVVPYPFDFSGSCPILLSCNDGGSNSTAALLRPTNAATTDHSYTVVSFNSTASTFAVSVPPSCNRTVSDAKWWLTGASYGVSSSTALFLRDCRNTTSAICSVPVETMLRSTPRCGGGGNETASSLTCIATVSPDPTAAEQGIGMFTQWEKVEEPMCDKVMTSMYGGDTRTEVFSLEFAMAKMRWWVNGSCSSNHSAGGVIDADGRRCAANATCRPRAAAGANGASACQVWSATGSPPAKDAMFLSKQQKAGTGE